MRNSFTVDGGPSAREDRLSNSPKRNASAKTKAAPVLRRAFAGKRGLPRLAMIGFVGLIAIGVPVNALLLQKGAHPAPLFQSGTETKPIALKDAPLPRPRPVSLADAEPAKTDAIKTSAKSVDLISRLIGGAPKAESAKKAEHAKKAASAKKTEIAKKTESAKTTESAKKSESPKKTDGVRFAQRALAKLGYDLHQDGVFGGTTRQAIEKFERANGMPVTGELTGKILHRLSARSGLALK